jgi:hypothetical protein
MCAGPAEALNAMGRLLQVSGLLLMAVALSGLLLASGNEALVALANPCLPGAPAATMPPATAAPNSHLVFAPSEDLPQQSPSALPSQPPVPVQPRPAAVPQCPAHRHHLFGEGPIEFSGSGGVDVGMHRTQNDFSGASAQNDANLSMDLQVSRRTEQTSIVVDQIFGETSGTYNLGQIKVGYDTPKSLTALRFRRSVW